MLVDTRADGAELKGLVSLAGSIAGPDDGLVIPFATSATGDRSSAAARMELAVEAAENLGLDTEGQIRIGESFPADTLGLIEEVDASLVILRWEGPRFPADYVFGTELDNVGSLSPVPAMAAHIVGPIERVVVATGGVGTAWHAEDVDLLLTAARHIYRSADVPVAIFTPDPELLDGRLAGFEKANLVSAESGAGIVLDALQPNDLLMMPTRVTQTIRTMNQRRLAHSLQEISVAVVGGPGRLTVSAGIVRRQVQGVVGTTR